MYIPNLKTSDSEIRAVRFLNAEVKKEITPAFELTRSRKTSKLPNGSVDVRMEQLLEAYGSDSFILDLSVEQDLINSEIVSLFDQTDGYKNWRLFVGRYHKKKLIPCLLYEDDGTKLDFLRQVSELSAKHDKLCLRLSANDDNAIKLYNWCLEVISQDRIIVIGNLYFIGQNELYKFKSYAETFVSSVIGNRSPHMLAVAVSSFPKSVVDVGYGEDDEGTFSAIEYSFFDELVKSFPNQPVVFSDFASVHPIRYPTRGGSWVPRVDMPIDDYLTYKRYRQSDGGYVKAAREIVTKHGHELVSCWGTDQVRIAASGGSVGMSPSYWISVRINCWISKVSVERIK